MASAAATTKATVLTHMGTSAPPRATVRPKINRSACAMATTARTPTVTVVNGFFMISPLTSVNLTAPPACGPRISNRDMADIGQTTASCPLPVQLRPPSAKAEHVDGTVYKVMSRTAFAEAKAKGRFEGSADDRRD